MGRMSHGEWLSRFGTKPRKKIPSRGDPCGQPVQRGSTMGYVCEQPNAILLGGTWFCQECGDSFARAQGIFVEGEEV